MPCSFTVQSVNREYYTMTLMSLISKGITTLVPTVPGVLSTQKKIYINKQRGKREEKKFSFQSQILHIKVYKGCSEAKVDNKWA